MATTTKRPEPIPLALYIGLPAAADLLAKLLGRKVSYTTVWKWSNEGMSRKSKGLKPLKLWTDSPPGSKFVFTTREAVERFAAEVNAH